MKLEAPTCTPDESNPNNVSTCVGQQPRRAASSHSTCVDLFVYLGVVLVVGVMVCMAVRICQDDDEPTVVSYHLLLGQISLYEEALKDVRSCVEEECCRCCTKHKKTRQLSAGASLSRTAIDVSI
ncbi:unnamed protein product [Ixodes persulcatus]